MTTVSEVIVLILAIAACVFFASQRLDYTKDQATKVAAKHGACIEFSWLQSGYIVVDCKPE